jgi:hypothetical protein
MDSIFGWHDRHLHSYSSPDFSSETSLGTLTAGPGRGGSGATLGFLLACTVGIVAPPPANVSPDGKADSSGVAGVPIPATRGLPVRLLIIPANASAVPTVVIGVNLPLSVCTSIDSLGGAAPPVSNSCLNDNGSMRGVDIREKIDGRLLSTCGSNTLRSSAKAKAGALVGLGCLRYSESNGATASLIAAG